MYDLVPYYNNYKWSTTAAGLTAHIAHDYLTAAPRTVTLTAEDDSKSMFGVTSQRDAILQYRRKPMPWRKKRKWVNFVKKVHAVSQKDEGTKVVIRNNTITCSWDNTDQFACCTTLYGLRGSDTSFSVGNADLNAIMGADAAADTQWEHVRFTSAIMDVTLCNTGANRLEIDIYEIGYGGRQSGQNLLSDLASSLTSAPLPGTGYAAVTTATRGFTPFEAPAFSAKGYRIFKKTKYFIPPNEILTYQMRDPKDRRIDGAQVWSVGVGTNAQMSYVTKNLLIIGKAVPGSSFAGAGDQNIYTVGVTRTYKYKDPGENTDAIGSI